MLNRITKDETDQMDLDVGTWKPLTFAPPPEVDKPTYEIVGSIERYDCRDHVFARIAMRNGSPPYEDYYQRHPEKDALDEKNRERAEKSGQKLVQADPVNERLAISGFSRAWIMSRPDYLEHRARMMVQPVGRVPQEQVQPDPQKMTRKVKALGLHLGAAKVRVASLDQRWVYTHKPVPHYGEPYHLDYPYVICMAVPQGPYFMDNHTGLSENWEVGWSYSYASFISFAVADFIRTLGWNARAIPTLSTPYLVTPLFVDCGIGEDGRCGYTVSKEIGNNWRPGGIATDLPLVPDKPVDFGLQDFCERCGICADTCPSGAIPKGGREVVRGYRKWHIDAEKCYAYWNTIGHSCGVCQSVCPWNHANSWFHKGIRELAQRFPSLRKSLVRGEEIFYSHNPKPPPRWMAEKVPFTLLDGN
ncbi:MAG: reductive dehalogenase [Pseudomonadota bacterium]